MNAKDITFLEDTFKKFYFENFDLLHVLMIQIKENLATKNLTAV